MNVIIEFSTWDTDTNAHRCLRLIPTTPPPACMRDPACNNNNNNNNNNRISIAPYGRNFRGAGARLLSVQVSQTPGLYAGPGVYPGPGLYHNMSSLCYFIQKNRQLSCLPGTSILFIVTLKHRILRRCKRGLQSSLYLLRNILIRIAWYN